MAGIGRFEDRNILCETERIFLTTMKHKNNLFSSFQFERTDKYITLSVQTEIPHARIYDTHMYV